MPFNNLYIAADAKSFFFLTKKQKYYNTSLFLDGKQWFAFNKLWEAIGNYVSEPYLKLQRTLKDYTSATCIFCSYLYLIIWGLHLNQFMMIFCTTTLSWYNTIAWVKKTAMSKVFEEA